MRSLSYAVAMVALVGAPGCTAVTKPTRPLASVPRVPTDFYVSTSFPKEPYATVGFVQVDHQSVTAAGLVDVGGAALDETAFSALVRQAREMKANGIVIVEFEDVDPPTDFDRFADAAGSLRDREIKTRERLLRFHAEFIRFGEGR